MNRRASSRPSCSRSRSLKERTTREVVIHLPGPSRNTMEALAELLSRHRGDRRVLLELDVKKNGGPGLRVRADVAQRVRPSEKLVEEVEQLCGAGRWLAIAGSDCASRVR